jgi:hypothetical protein
MQNCCRQAFLSGFFRSFVDPLIDAFGFANTEEGTLEYLQLL